MRKHESFEGGVGKLFLNYSFVRKFLFLVKIVNCPLPCGTPMFLCFLNNLNKIIEKNFPDGSDAKLNVLQLGRIWFIAKVIKVISSLPRLEKFIISLSGEKLKSFLCRRKEILLGTRFTCIMTVKYWKHSKTGRFEHRIKRGTIHV